MTEPKDYNIDDLMERLADIEHQRWADWQKWVHKVLREVHEPSPEYGDILERWDRQIETPYSELSEKEKQSDRNQVMRYLPLLKDLMLEIIGEDEKFKNVYQWQQAEPLNHLRQEQRQKLSDLFNITQ